MKEERKQKIFDMWLACHTQEEIAKEVNLNSTDKSLRLSGNIEEFPNNQKLSATFQDDFDTPLYNVWAFAKKTNNTRIDY